MLWFSGVRRGRPTPVMFLSLTDSPAVVEEDEDQLEDNDGSLRVSNKVSTHIPSEDRGGLTRWGGGPHSSHKLKARILLKMYNLEWV